MLSYKNAPTRTYARSFKSKEEGASILGLGHGEMPVEYETACRLCLNKADIMSDIFGDLDNIVPVTVKMKNLLGIEVYEEDRLPTLICEDCLRQLNDAYSFKKRCLASDVKLRQYLCTPLKPLSCSYFELADEDKERESDTNSYSEENLYSLKPVKEECTIRWDDQVPLAAIITSATHENVNVSNNNLTGPPTDENLSSESNNWHHVVWDYQTAGTEPEKRTPVKKSGSPVVKSGSPVVKSGSPVVKSGPPVVKSGSPVVKSFKVINSSGYVCKIKPDTGTYDQKAIDLDDIPLLDRIRIENERFIPVLQRKRQNKKKQKYGGEMSPSSQHAPEVEISEGPEEEKRPVKMFRNMHVCSSCSKAFLTPSLLARHLRIHTGEKPFRCDVCNSAFSQKEILQRHVAQVHSEVKPHKCKYCGKSYGTYSILAVHVKTAHVKYGQYKCKHCAKIFRHASGLSRHQNLHNGTYFYCKICGKHFNDGSSVKRHIKVHSGLSELLE